MEWLLIILVSLPPQKVDIGDLRFLSKEECMDFGDRLVKGGLDQIGRQSRDGNKDKIVRVEPTLPVVRSEVQCIEVAINE